MYLTKTRLAYYDSTVLSGEKKKKKNESNQEMVTITIGQGNIHIIIPFLNMHWLFDPTAILWWVGLADHLLIYPLQGDLPSTRGFAKISLGCLNDAPQLAIRLRNWCAPNFFIRFRTSQQRKQRALCWGPPSLWGAECDLIFTYVHMECA